MRVHFSFRQEHGVPEGSDPRIRKWGRVDSADCRRGSSGRRARDFRVPSKLLQYLAATLLRQMVDYDASDENKRPAFILQFEHDCLLSGPYSLTVRDPARNSKLVGIRLNKMKEKTSSTRLNTFDDDTSDDRFESLVQKFLATINAGVDCFTMFNAERILTLNMMAVDPEYEHRRLATSLYELSVAMARAHGAGAVTMEAVSNFAYRAATKNGFTVVRRLPLEELVFRGSKPLAGRRSELGVHCEGYLLARPL